MNRRDFLHAAAAATVGSAITAPALAKQMPDPKGTTPPPRDWYDPASAVEPDPAFEAFDPRGTALNGGTAGLLRIWTGGMFTEGPVWFGDWHRVVWSDIPTDTLYEYNAWTGETRVLRRPSGHANGNTRDRQGRLLTCEHGNRRLTRTEYTGKITVLADNYQGKKLNSPNGVIVKSDNTIWFTDATYGLILEHQGYHRGESEIHPNVYIIDPKTGKMTIVADDFSEPNGLCFSPDEKKLYVTDTGAVGGPPNSPSWIRVFDVSEDNKLTNSKVFHDLKQSQPGAISDDIRADTQGNIWSAGGWGTEKDYNGVSIYAPDGTPIARIVLPEIAANLCFGGRYHDTLYICASKSVYALNVNANGVEL